MLTRPAPPILQANTSLTFQPELIVPLPPSVLRPFSCYLSRFRPCYHTGFHFPFQPRECPFSEKDFVHCQLPGTSPSLMNSRMLPVLAPHEALHPLRAGTMSPTSFVFSKSRIEDFPHFVYTHMNGIPAHIKCIQCSVHHLALRASQCSICPMGELDQNNRTVYGTHPCHSDLLLSGWPWCSHTHRTAIPFV